MKYQLKTTLAAALLACNSAPAWAINKCTIDGKTVYQEAACEGAKKVDVSGAGKAVPDSPGTSYWQRQITSQARAERVSKAIANREIFIGMTSEEARQSWGAPTKINVSVGSYGRHEQWVFPRGRVEAQYVYIENGLVKSMQSPE